ncbi:MAG TPA: hypothetical protein DF774_10365 [Rheinheimera sp.]|uniref:hypothetical protein n=1 Tax=Rheinheimera sp. TaxID=1869214 RepID=UPI000ECCD318|nr:hypothetical protein [Rheinheimera sp.]HCU66150.1 hypothetical protein [Rheinheimera sp.]
MSFVILAIRPFSPVQPLTSRATERMALYTAQSFEQAYKGQCKTKVVAVGTTYCNQCGTTSFMNSADCKSPINPTSPDWQCGLGVQGVSYGVVA